MARTFDQLIAKLELEHEKLGLLLTELRAHKGASVEAAKPDKPKPKTKSKKRSAGEWD